MDSNQKIWIASDHGIITISRNLKNLKFYLSRMAGEKDDKVINAIFIDTYGNVWGGSKNGLYRYDPVSDQFLIEPTIPSLKTAWITNIEEDSLNRLWLNLNYNRIARYDRIKHEYKTYYVHNGTRSNRMNTYEFFKADEHHMYIGGEKGIYSFDPLNITENTYSPRPFISGVRVNNKDISPEDTINNNVPLKEDINFSHQIVLQYQNRNVTFDLSSASYVNRISNRFKYRLKGHDKQWVMLPMRSHYINFSRLSVGSYVLELQACNNNGHWSDIQHYTIRVLAPWWISGWAYFFYFIFAGLVIFYLIVQGRHRQTLRRALMTEQIKREQTEVLNEDKLRFFTNISHELRTPLTLILGPAYQLSEDKTLNNMAHKKIVMIRSHAQRMLSLINQILDLRKAESGRLQLKVSLVQLNKLTQEVYASFTDFAASKNICFDFNRDPNVMEGYVDKGMYMTMLYNLVSNALKFTPEKGHVSLSLKLKEQRGSRYLLVTVADDGIGIPKEGQVHIFSRFYQAANSHSSTTGSGIGLSLVQRMVELHGGKISFDSVERQGTTFYIELPIDKQAYPAAAIQLETSKKRLLQKEKVRSDMFDVTIAQKSPAFVKDEETLGCMRNKKTILLIEDNQELRSFAADILSNHYQVEQASDGVEGLEKCREIQPNLCVVDVMMPRLDGFGFLEILKQEEAISHIPVVMLTAMDENKNRMFGYKLGADAYLTKPFDPNLLMSRIENILRNRKLLLNRFATGIPKEKRTLVDEAVALGSSPLDEVFLKKMTELIAKNISNSEFTVKEFSKEMAVSTSKLYRKIKGLTDLSPNEYLRLIRLKEGARLLKETNLSISEISYQVGFSDPLYFSRCFKKQFNKAPSEVRK